ncbi:MAG: nucleotidyltransferase family protein [Candidatus Omnitrophica bacterium]|nr:nucleotidyltransferase family protein [Candidatus Omnitrophota bacterium]
MITDLKTLCVGADASLLEVIALMDRSRLGIALVVDEEGLLEGTITDGDIRRSMLARIPLEESARQLLDRKASTPYARPVTAPWDADPQSHLDLLQKHRILHLPLLDERGRVKGLVTQDDFLPDPVPVKAVVMAGGEGKRLSPLTQETPKPLLPVGDRPLLEIILRQLKGAGIRQVQVATWHQSDKIANYFKDGKEFGMELSYITEERPLGTAGGLRRLETPQQTTLVMNGDILTQMDFRSMLVYHREHQADMTVAVRRYELKVPYGVVKCQDHQVVGISEKPMIDLFVNAGIYLLEPAAYRFIPDAERFDMTDLIQHLVEAGRPVVSFPIR